IRLADIAWAFSGLDLNVDSETGEVVHEGRPILHEADDRRMLAHYGIEGESTRIWQTVTPIALPIRRPKGHRTAAERVANEVEVVYAVRQALRHAEIPVPAERVRV